jgi:hypothetical protein
MRDKKFKDFKREGHHSGEHHKGKDRVQHRGAKTFRRGRALAFLEMMNLKRSTIKQQLDKPEFQSINQILVGELKAIDMIINEFIQLFEIQESEVTEVPDDKDKETEISLTHSEGSLDNGKKGIEFNEEN